MEYAIETFSLTKIFSDWWGRSKVCAVNNLDLQIKKNEVFGLLGPNGSGKTTTLKMLLGLLHPTKSKAVVLGGNGFDPNINKRIGFMPEESYLYKYLTARETLNFYGQLFNLPRNVRKRRIEALLNMVGLKAVANRAVGTFSKGMARRIGLAQALINDPDLLILDEPTTGLDPIGTRQIKDLILQLADRGKTVLLCSHLLADVEDVCNRIAILYGGKIQAQGKVKELLQVTDKREIVTGAISDEAVEKIKQIIKNENADCIISSPMDRLETFFMRTVAEAQQKQQTTSGAVSTTEIGEFLTTKLVKENILNKLTEEKTVTPQQKKEKKRIKTVKTVSTTEVKQDNELLDTLTKKDEPAKTKPVPETKPNEVENRQEEFNKSVLEQLMEKPKEKISDNPDGETSNA